MTSLSTCVWFAAKLHCATNWLADLLAGLLWVHSEVMTVVSIFFTRLNNREYD